ncbi:MAG: glycosyltransferase [Candidatus Omnitrophica bacterium]|nr:glycosyltransferase [Candidatus Omnitrophota bacterium]MBD3269104.1 glycosyltransferase [Candidatus Omnitrophota bacterium]
MISLIIPTRNRPESVSLLLDSILRHSTCRDFEILIVDDNSSPSNKDLLRRVTVKDKFSAIPVRCIYNEKRMYPGYSRNRGVREAKGDILYFVDDDCRFLNDNLTLISEFYGSQKNTYIITAGDCICTIADVSSVLYNDFFRCSLFLFWTKSRRSLAGRLFSRDRLNNFFLRFAPSLNMACRISVFEKGSFSQKCRVNEDEMFCEQVTREGCKILFKKELRVAHNHEFLNFSELLRRLAELGSYYKSKKILKRCVFVILYPLVLSLFTRKPYFVFHYCAMSYAWAFLRNCETENEDTTIG